VHTSPSLEARQLPGRQLLDDLSGLEARGWGSGEAQHLASLEVDDERLTSSYSLGLPSEFPGRFQELFTSEHNVFPSRDKPPLSDDPLLIDQEEGPLGDPELCQGGIVREAAVLLSDLQIRKVAEQWVRQLERLRKSLLREGMVGTDPENAAQATRGVASGIGEIA
jgi:hypothetical protein